MEVPRMEDNVQLREEEIVGDEVVLSDIYPKTNTSSVVDDISGTTLNETLDRIQEKINNKLSRVVNSVNGRTGVVVLDSEDVGLGNVDNVSFSDIKGWVINLLVSEFANKRIALLNSLDEADAIANENKEANRDRPFFAQSGYSNLRDKKSYIGYFYYDDSVKKLKITYRSINTIGSTDGSLIYDTSVGNLMVRIKSTEKALRVSQDLSDPGLYIDKSNVMPTIRYFDGVWGRIDSNYTPDVDQTDTPSGSTNNTEYKYRTAIKGFCPDTTIGLDARECQHIILRFHSDKYMVNRDEYDKYTADSLSYGDLYEGYYIGDRAFDEHQNGTINFETGHSSHNIKPYKNTGQFDPSVILYGQREQGIYYLTTEETTQNVYQRSMKNEEYVLLRTNAGTLQPDEVIYCAFRSPINGEGKQIVDGQRYLPNGVDLETLEFLTNRTPAYGIVHRYPNADPARLVVIEFYEQEIHPGWSLEYSNKTGTKSLEINVSKAKVPTAPGGNLLKWDNFSGLQTISANNYDDAVIGADGYRKLTSQPGDWLSNWMNYYEYDSIGVTYDLLGDKYPNMVEDTGLCGFFAIEKQYLRTKDYAEFVTTGKYAPTSGERSAISPTTSEPPSYINPYTYFEKDETTGGTNNSKLNQFLKLMPYESFLEEPRQFDVEYVWGGKEFTQVAYVAESDRTVDNWYVYAQKLMTYSVYYTDPYTPSVVPELYKAHPYITETIYNQAAKAPDFYKTETIAGETSTVSNDYYEYIKSLQNRHKYVMLPSGPTKVYDSDYSRTGGLFINPDASLCIIPKNLCFYNSGPENPNYEQWADIDGVLNNWRPSLPKTRYAATDFNVKNDGVEESKTADRYNSNGIKDDDCYVGINLMKGLKWYPGRWSYKLLTQKPVLWDDEYMNYYYKSDAYNPPQFVHVEGVTPDSSSATTKVAPEFEAGTYYELVDGATPDHMTSNKYYSYNLSGLRVLGNYDDFDQTKVDYSWIGMNYGEYESRYKLDTTQERNLNFNVKGGIMHSGGLSVNVGKFLEIDPGRYDRKYINWYDNGKINVRIGKGLEEEPIVYDSYNRPLTGNRIQLALDSESGFNFNSDGKLTLKNVKITTLDFVDTYDTHFLYDPLPEFPFKSSTSYNNVTFQIGRGLKLVTDETRARDFDSLMDSMTVVQLEIFLDCADEQIGHINQKIAKRKSLCKKDDVALAADTEAIKRVQAYHPAREKDTDLPYYWLSLNDMIQWAIDNGVEGVGSDDHGPTSEDSTSIPRDIASMSLRTFKDNVAYRWITMDQSQLMNRIGCYKDETLKMITPYTEENTAPLAVMLTYYSISDLDETPYDSVVRKAHNKIVDLYTYYLNDATFDHDWVTHPITYNGTTYSSPIPLIQDICKDIRTAFANTALNPKSFDDKLSDDESLHISADSLSELWLDIVEHGGASKSGYHTAQQWLDDSSIGLTKRDIVNSIDALADMDDYGWKERAKIFKERLHGDDVQNVVTVRDTAGLVVHKISLAYLKLVENKTETISSTDITKTTYKQLTSTTPPDDWNNAESLNKYCVKYIPTKAYSAYEANKYYRATATAFELIGSAPTLWDKSYFKFYEKSNTYKHIAKAASAPEFKQNTYYKMTEVSFTQLTTSTFDDETYVGTGDNYAVFPPTDDDWTGKAVNDQTTTTTSDVTSGNREYSRVQADVQYTYNDNGSVVATLTPNISSTDISAATTDATKLNNWKNTWPQYWTEAPLPYPTLAQAGYTKMPYYVKGMFYEKQEPTGTQEVQVLTDIVSISDAKLTKDEYTQNRSVSPSPNWEQNTYYSKSIVYEYLAIYEEPNDWASMNWSRDNNKYYNYKYQLITTNPGGFLPNLYYTRRQKEEYTLLTEKPVDWDTPEGYQKYYTRTAGSQVKIRTDVTNATWLDNGERLTPAEQYNTWVVVKTDENVHAGLDGFVGEDLNTLMLYVLGRKWSMKEMLSRASSESAWITWTKDIKDEEESSST
jgi:hypothetical protein